MLKKSHAWLPKLQIAPESIAAGADSTMATAIFDQKIADRNFACDEHLLNQQPGQPGLPLDIIN